MFGAWAAAWPLIRADLHLTYVQVGLLLSLPQLFGNVVEPAVGVLGDAWDRRALIRSGGVVFAAAVLGIALSHAFAPLLVALALVNPASGAFVSLSQAVLMDLDPRGHELNMARWALAGSVGVVAGPLLLGAVVGAGLGWRGAFIACAVVAVLLLALVWRAGVATPPSGVRRSLGRALRQGTRDAFRALGRPDVLRWLTLLEFINLMLDILLDFLALYLVDIVGLSGARAGFAIAVWTGVGLLGDAALIPLLKRMDGLRYLRASALAVLFLFPAFLLVDDVPSKVVLLGALGLLDSGWYAILQGRLYSAMPGRSAAVMTLGNLFGLAGGLLPLALGVIAERYGLGAAMWLLMAAPIALLVGLPARSR